MNGPPQLRRQVTEAHHAFMAALDAAEKQFAGRLPPDERLAIAAQFVGQLIGELPEQYDPDSVMQAVAGNMAAGNKQATDGKGRGVLVQ